LDLERTKKRSGKSEGGRRKRKKEGSWEWKLEVGKERRWEVEKVGR
jgi:hypothetical protein